MKTIKCKVLAGNKGQPVNPYNEGYYQDPETGIKHYYDADYDIWQEFEDNNPILDLTTPCEEGQIVECGAEHVWQYTIANEWVTFPNTRKFIYADSFCEFSNFCSEARLAYQPLQNHISGELTGREKEPIQVQSVSGETVEQAIQRILRKYANGCIW